MKKLFIRFCNIRIKTPVLESLFNKDAGVSCKYCEFSKHTYFEEDLGTAASENHRSF